MSMSITKRKGLLLVLSSPSGAGKSTIARALFEQDRGLELSISMTTRPMRPAERDGREYYFVSDEEFERQKKAGNLLEFADVFGYAYGTPRALVEEKLAAGIDVLFDIDWQGGQQLRHEMRDDVVSIFILPPSVEILESRLHRRAQDSEEVIASRMAEAQSELSHWAEYDYIIINDDLEVSLEQARSVLHAERCKRQRLSGIGDFVHSLM